MAISANTVWQVKAGGSANNGGGYVSGAGVDYSQQNSAQLTVTDAASSSTTNLNSVTGGFTSNMVNNIVNVVGQGRRQITAFVDTNNVTCDAAWGTFSGATANVGGALAGPEDADLSYVGGNIIYIENGTSYSKTTTRTMTCDGSAAGGYVSFIGHIPGARQDKSLAQADYVEFTSATNSIALFTFNGHTRARYRNIKLSHTAVTRGNGIASATANSNSIVLEDVLIDGCANGIRDSLQISFAARRIEIRNCTSMGVQLSNTSSVPTIREFYIHDNASNGVQFAGNSCIIEDGFFDSNAGHGVNATATSASTLDCRFTNLTIYNCTNNGINFAATSNTPVSITLENCIFMSNVIGVACANSGIMDSERFNVRARGNSFYNHSTGPRNNFITGDDDTPLTADPFTDAANGDFSLNGTAGGGADCFQTGWPGVLGNGTTRTNYIDRGANQKQSTGGSFARAVMI